MSKRRNIVILNGPLYLEKLATVNLDGNEVPIAVCAVETDRPALGGRHRVLAYGRMAQEVAAFVQAAGHNPLDCTVDGWLRTMPDESAVVIADKITFHVGAEAAAEARRLLAEAGVTR